jgi:hypothetical protein
MKILEALDCLDDYCDSVEPVIQRRIKGRVAKNESKL